MLSVILDIILIILKIIGIGLLALLGILIALLLIILFVPVRYKSSGSFEKNEDGFKFAVSGGVTWLLRIISVRFELKDKQSDFSIRIFGKRLKQKSDEDMSVKKSKKAKKSKKKKEEKSDNGKSENVKTEVDTEVKPIEIKTQPQMETVEQLDHNITTENVSNDTSDSLNESETKAKKSFKQKILGIFDKIEKICNKIRHINDVKNSFIEFLKKEDAKKAMKEIKNIIFKVIKHILPRKLKARLHFGLKDPATTGQVLGITSIFYGIYGDNLILEPDFEKVALNGEYELKGRIRAFTLLIAAFKIYRNKWLKGFISFSKKSVKDL